jgi:hypothetical protein
MLHTFLHYVSCLMMTNLTFLESYTFELFPFFKKDIKHDSLTLSYQHNIYLELKFLRMLSWFFC